MKVICIESYKGKKSEDYIFPNGYTVKNEIYSVVGTVKENVEGYKLEEKPVYWRRTGQEIGWPKSQFVPLEYWKEEFDIKEEVPNCVGVEV